MKKILTLIAPIMLLLSSNIMAEEISDLAPVVVEASRTEKPVTAIPNTITIIDQQEIDIQTAISGDVQSILENTVPGFGPSLQKLVGRGESLRGRNPLYLIDGIPQHNPLRDGQRDGHTIDPDFLERIEVINGSNSIQGIGATGGVVGMVTKKAPDSGEWINEAKVALTNHDSFDSDGFHYKGIYLGGKKFDRFDFIGGVSYHKRDLFFDADHDPIGLYATQGDIMDSAATDLFLKVGFEPDSYQRIQLMVNDFNLEGDGDYVPIAGNRKQNKLSGTEQGNPRPTRGEPVENDVTSISLNYSHDNLSGGYLKTQLFHQDFKARYQGGKYGNYFRLTPTGPAFLDQSQIESKKVGFKSAYSLPDFLISGFQPTVGLDLFSDKSKQVLVKSGREWVPEIDLRSIAPFVQLDYKLSQSINVTAGLRHEHAKLEVDDFVTIAAAGSTSVSGGKPDFTELLPNAGITFDIGYGLSVYSSYAEGFSLPDVGRVLRAINTQGQDVDSIIDLDPIITKNKEIGFNYDFQRGSIHVAYYWSDSDLGQRLEKDSSNIFHVKREKTRIQGFEAAADFNINQTFATGFNYTWLKGKFDSDKNGSLDSDLDGSNIAPNRLNVWLDTSFNNGITARLQASHLFDRNFRGSKAPKDANFDSYTTADLYLNKELDTGEISLAVDNLLDKQYVTYFSQTESQQRNDTFFAGNGRTITLIYSLKF